MDAVVLQAMAKWPDVPSVFGWLSLDRRGQYAIKGERILNPTIHAFIGRNYGCDDAGRWYFQNGPQRVFIKLDYTPFVLRSSADDSAALTTHVGTHVQKAHGAFLDDKGQLLVCFGRHVGVLHDQDLHQAISWLRNAQGQPVSDSELEAWYAGQVSEIGCRLVLGQTRVPVRRIRAVSVASRFGFDPDPMPSPGEPEC